MTLHGNHTRANVVKFCCFLPILKFMANTVALRFYFKNRLKPKPLDLDLCVCLISLKDLFKHSKNVKI